MLCTTDMKRLIVALAFAGLCACGDATTDGLDTPMDPETPNPMMPMTPKVMKANTAAPATAAGSMSSAQHRAFVAVSNGKPLGITRGSGRVVTLNLGVRR